MEKDELRLLNDYNNMSENAKNTFMSNIESDLKYNTHFYKKEYDFKWLDVMEDTTKYIDNILKEPKVFILNEEEIVLIEKSKKVSVESVVHLTQHSGYVSEYNKNTGEIRPSKILNITREETMNIYENRFIYSLINKMADFIENYGILALEGSSSINNKSLNYTAKSKYKEEHVNIRLNIETIEDKSILSKEKVRKINDRIYDLRDKINSFRNSILYKNLSSLNVTEVKSPIKKTNVILKNPNFQRAEYLWNFLENYDKNIKHETKYLKNYSTNEIINEKLDNAFLLNYSVLLNDNISFEEDIDIINKNFFINSIEKFLSNNTYISEEKFINMVKKEYEIIRKKQERDYKDISNIIANDISDYVNKIENVFK